MAKMAEISMESVLKPKDRTESWERAANKSFKACPCSDNNVSEKSSNWAQLNKVSFVSEIHKKNKQTQHANLFMSDKDDR